MGRCTNTNHLRLLHRVAGSGPEMGNVKVFCDSCYRALVGAGKPDEGVGDVSPDTKDRALRRAGFRCECTGNKGCH